MNKGGRIQRKGIERGLDLPFLNPGAGERVAVGTLQRKHPVLEHPEFIQRLGVRSGEIDVPLAVNPVQLRCPDQLTHRAGVGLAPDHHLIGPAQPLQRVGTADLQPVVLRHRGNKVVLSFMMKNVRVSALFNKRVWPGLHSAFLILSQRR